MRWIVAALFIAVVSLGGTTMLYAAWHRSAYAGSYAIRICRGHCADPVEAPYLVGMLILFDRPVLDVHGHALRLDLERHPANGCFVLKQAPGQPGSYDGFPRQNYISWSLTQSRNAIDFELFAHPMRVIRWSSHWLRKA